MFRIFFMILIPYAVLLSALLWRKAPVRRESKRPLRAAAGPMRLLVIGATGGTGRELVQQALAQGHQVTAFVRDPARLPIEHENLRVGKGDVLDYTSVEAAMRGQEAVLSALGHRRFYRPTKIQSEGMRNILQAMTACGVSRLICETALGLGNSIFRMGIPGTFFMLPLVLPFYFWDKARQEDLIRASDLDWTIVRPGILTSGAARRKYRDGPNVGNYFWPASSARADVADFMLKQLKDDTYVGMAPGMAG